MNPLDRSRRSVERILEDESLTSGLLDPAAKALLNWGVAQAQILGRCAETVDEETFQARLNALRGTLKQINEEASEADRPDEQLSRVYALIQRYRESPCKNDQEQSEE